MLLHCPLELNLRSMRTGIFESLKLTFKGIKEEFLIYRIFNTLTLYNFIIYSDLCLLLKEVDMKRTRATKKNAF